MQKLRFRKPEQETSRHLTNQRVRTLIDTQEETQHPQPSGRWKSKLFIPIRTFIVRKAFPGPLRMLGKENLYTLLGRNISSAVIMKRNHGSSSEAESRTTFISRSTQPGNISKGSEAAERRDICLAMSTEALSRTPLVIPMYWIGWGIVGNMHFFTKGLSNTELHFKSVKKLPGRNSNSSRVSISWSQSKGSRLYLCSVSHPRLFSQSWDSVKRTGFFFLSLYNWLFLRISYMRTVFASLPTTPPLSTLLLHHDNTSSHSNVVGKIS